MRVPTICGVIDRRILVNYRVEPEVLAAILPPPFRPQLVGGSGIAGICLIRLKQMRPLGMPAWLGISSENAAHRIAVEWDVAGETKTGVYIPRRDTSSWLNYLAGGRVFPGVHHHANFRVEETNDRYRVAVESADGGGELSVDGHLATSLPDDSIFKNLAAASDFFECGSLGYSPSGKSSSNGSSQYDGLELRGFNWHVEPLAVENVESSFFNDRRQFPAGSVEFDCALLMHDIQHEWHAHPSLAAACAVA
jgi:hypothetical protein